MLGLKRFKSADIVISGIKPAEKIRKEQFKMGDAACDLASHTCW